MGAAVPALDKNKLDEFLGKAVNDMGAAMHSALLVIGERLGLFKAMAEAGPVTPAELAQLTQRTRATFRNGSTRTRPAVT